MGASASLKAKTDLEAKLRQWMRVTSLFAQRRESRFKVHPEHYRKLHQHLLHMVSSAEDSADSPEQSVYRELRETLMPWVNVESLTKADRELLLEVLAECEVVRRTLRGRPAASGWWAWPTVLLVVAGFGVGVLLVLWGRAGGPDTALDMGLWLRYWVRWAFATFVGTSLHRQLLVGGDLAAVITMIIVWYSARKY